MLTLLIAGVDEAGRGPLAGPVYAAAVILHPERPIASLTDSKKLSAKRRTELAEKIRKNALAWNIASASTEEIDRLNILQATFLAMRRACENLCVMPQEIIIDGRALPPGLNAPARAVIKADDSFPQVAAASILAKTARDQWCMELDQRYPEYGFAQHKGYGTALHMERLQVHGPCPEHRRSFAPVKRLLQGSRPAGE